MFLGAILIISCHIHQKCSTLNCDPKISDSFWRPFGDHLPFIDAIWDWHEGIRIQAKEFSQILSHVVLWRCAIHGQMIWPKSGRAVLSSNIRWLPDSTYKRPESKFFGCHFDEIVTHSSKCLTRIVLYTVFGAAPRNGTNMIFLVWTTDSFARPFVTFCCSWTVSFR